MILEGAIMLLAFDFQQFSDLALFDNMFKDDWQKVPDRGRSSPLRRTSCKKLASILKMFRRWWLAFTVNWAVKRRSCLALSI